MMKAKEHLVSLCMIVRNEETNLQRCLRSVHSAVDEIIVIDTGSTDNTERIALDAGAKLRHFLWNGSFSDARNASLEMATGEWILFLDADEELSEASLPAVRELAASKEAEGYFVKIINHIGSTGRTETCPDLVFRFFRNRPEYRFRGVIHEQIADVILERNPQAVFKTAGNLIIHHYGYLDDQVEAKSKKTRNLALIEEELTRNPADTLLRYHYGVELFRAGQHTEAAAQLTKAAGEADFRAIFYPKLVRYLVLAYQSAGLHKQALNVVAQGIGLFPEYGDLYYYAGTACFQLKQYAKAREYFLKAVSLPEPPTHFAPLAGVRGFRAYYQLGQIAEAFLNEEDALGCYIAALRDSPHFVAALEAVIRILNPRQYPEYTRECVGKICDFHTPLANQVIAEIYQRLGAYSLAIAHLEKSGDSPLLQLRKSVCLIQEGRYLEALRLLGSFTPGTPLYPQARINEFFLYCLEGKKRKARTLLAEICSLGLPEDMMGILCLIAGSACGNKKILAACQEKGILLEEGGSVLLLDLTTRLLYKGAAERVLELLARIRKESLSAHILPIAELFRDYGYGEYAEKLLLQSTPAGMNGSFFRLLGDLAEKRGEWVEAEQYYRQAVEKDPNDPGGYIKLVRLYEDQRRRILEGG